MADKPTFGRYTELPLEKMTAEQRKGYDNVMTDRGVCPGPYKIWVENPSIMNLMVPLGVYYRTKSSLNDAEREIATLLIVTKWGAAFPCCEHEWIAESREGYSHAAIPAEKVERMMVGLPVAFDDPRHQIIYEVSLGLVNSRYIPKGVYDRAVETLGYQGITDLTVLIGYYSMVALTLMVYDVPSCAEGLER